MVSGVRKLSNLVLYSSLWIALCAAAQVQLTYDLTGVHRGLDNYTWLILASTLVLYSIHRIVGIRRVRAFEDIGRFAVINQYRSHIMIYGVIGAVATAWLVFRLPLRTLLYLAVPVLISAAYVLPLKPGSMRLRDIPLIKIFLIAASWSLITTTVPLLHHGYGGGHLAAIFTERFLLIIAITIPFDIRDHTVDRQARVQTIPHTLGIRKSKILAIALLGVSAAISIYLVQVGHYPAALTLPLAITILCAIVLIVYSKPNLDDHYYSGLLDGVLFLLPFLYWIWSGESGLF